jgi:flavin reductase
MAAAEASASFKLAMRRLASGVCLVATHEGGLDHGFVASAVTSVSAEPPTLLVCINRTATSHDPLLRAGIFCVNVLTQAHEDLARRFSQPDDRHLRFADRNWIRLVSGAPVLEDGLAVFDCRLAQAVAVATHTIVIGHVVATRTAGPVEPLVYIDGRFTTAASRGGFHPAFDLDRGWG